MTTTTTKPAAKPTTKIKVECMECGKKWSIRATALSLPLCPRCHGADVDVAS